MLLGFDDYKQQANELAASLGKPCHVVQQHRFPDGESKLTLPAELPEHVIFYRSLDYPNKKLIELLLAAKTARELGARKLTLVAPYLCYMRQDKAFHPGEVISQKIIGKFLADLFENVITVDPHLHRIQNLQQAIPASKAVSLSATTLMTDFLQQRFENIVLVGPDSESEQWVSAIARPGKWSFVVCHKVRTGDEEVSIRLPEINLGGATVVLVDDVISSGQTIAVAARQCIAGGAAEVNVLTTHALFAPRAKERILEAGVKNIWSSNSIHHESNIISLVPLLRDAVAGLD